jgi:hypothetical protein
VDGAKWLGSEAGGLVSYRKESVFAYRVTTCEGRLGVRNREGGGKACEELLRVGRELGGHAIRFCHVAVEPRVESCMIGLVQFVLV